MNEYDGFALVDETFGVREVSDASDDDAGVEVEAAGKQSTALTISLRSASAPGEHRVAPSGGSYDPSRPGSTAPSAGTEPIVGASCDAIGAARRDDPEIIHEACATKLNQGHNAMKSTSSTSAESSRYDGYQRSITSFKGAQIGRCSPIRGQALSRTSSPASEKNGEGKFSVDGESAARVAAYPTQTLNAARPNDRRPASACQQSAADNAMQVPVPLTRALTVRLLPGDCAFGAVVPRKRASITDLESEMQRKMGLRNIVHLTSVQVRTAGPGYVPLSGVPDGGTVTARPVDHVLVRARVSRRGLAPASDRDEAAVAPPWDQYVSLPLRSSVEEAINILRTELGVPPGHRVHPRRVGASPDEAQPTSVACLRNGDTLVLHVLDAEGEDEAGVSKRKLRGATGEEGIAVAALSGVSPRSPRDTAIGAARRRAVGRPNAAEHGAKIGEPRSGDTHGDRSCLDPSNAARPARQQRLYPEDTGSEGYPREDTAITAWQASGTGDVCTASPFPALPPVSAYGPGAESPMPPPSRGSAFPPLPPKSAYGPAAAPPAPAPSPPRASTFRCRGAADTLADSVPEEHTPCSDSGGNRVGSSGPSEPASTADEADISELVGMGFDRRHVVRALQQCGRGSSWKESAISLLLEPQMSRVVVSATPAAGEEGQQEEAGQKRRKGTVADGPARCPICLSGIAADEVFTVDCKNQHVFCVDCLYQHCCVQLLDSALIPACPLSNSECGHELSQEEVERVFLLKTYEQADGHSVVVGGSASDAAEADKDQRALNTCRTLFTRRGLESTGAVPCISADCGNWMVPEEGGQRVRCGSCLVEFCSSCKRSPYHYAAECNDVVRLTRDWSSWLTEGKAAFLSAMASEDKAHKALLEQHKARKQEHDRTVQEADRLRAEYDRMEDWKEKRCRRCPSCKRTIEKISGCEFMTCGRDAHGGNVQNGCGARFVWSAAPRYVGDRGVSKEKPFTEREPQAAAKARHFIAPFFPLRCDRCHQDVVGPLFRCIHCPSFACCLECQDMASRDPCHVHHIFRIVDAPEDTPSDGVCVAGARKRGACDMDVDNAALS